MRTSHYEILATHPTYESVPGYWDRHERGLAIETFSGAPSLGEAIALMLRGWTAYADAHAKRYEAGIGDDGVLGPEWEAIGKALLGLLNGDLGRLDGGALDHAIRASLTAEGFEPEK